MRAEVGGASTPPVCWVLVRGLELPSRISPVLRFWTPHPPAREARGTYANQWLSLSRAKESPTQNDTTLIMENLFKQARTYFSKNC